MPRYRLLRGVHHHAGRTYRPQDVFDHDGDLLRFNSPGSIRFERVDASVALAHGRTPKADAPKGDDLGLGEMTAKELRQFAEGEGIDLGDATTKTDIAGKIDAAFARV